MKILMLFMLLTTAQAFAQDAADDAECVMTDTTASTVKTNTDEVDG